MFGERTMGFKYKDKENLTNEVKRAGRRFPHTLLLCPTYFVLALGFHDWPELGGGKVTNWVDGADLVYVWPMTHDYAWEVLLF